MLRNFGLHRSTVYSSSLLLNKHWKLTGADIIMKKNQFVILGECGQQFIGARKGSHSSDIWLEIGTIDIY